jgi:hypothetical protein
MRWVTIRNVLLTAALVNVCAIGVLHAGQLRTWGLDRDGQVTGVPTGTDFVAVAAGDAHGLALRSDGTVAAWGQNDDGECDVPAGTYKAIGAGADFSLAIRTDGSIAAWGDNGQRQISSVPAGYDFVAVDGGERFAVALKADGSIVAWGNNRWGQVSDVPSGTGFRAVVAGDDHAVALRSDGSLVSWGYWAAAEGTPTSGTFTAIGAGGSFCVALKDDGSLVWWGDDPYGYDFARVPTGTGYVAISAGYLHALALKRDGSVVGWGAGADVSGHPNWGQAMPPAGNDYTALAGGLYFSLALTGKVDPTDPQEPSDPTDPTGPADPTVLADDFNDNRLSSSWKLYGEDLLNCWLEEANQRLELMATSKTQGVSAYCLGNGWRIDPTDDFAFQVDYHYSLVTDQGGWVFLGITPDVNDLDTRYVKLGVGCDRQYPYIWYEAIDGKDMQMDYNNRRQDDGALYVSFNAAKDELYLSGTGYGSDNAWAVIANVLGTSWGGAPVVVFLGGGSNGLEIRSGDAWLDNFTVETGASSKPPLDSISEVYRFWSPVISRHFYTIDPAERDHLIGEYSHAWTYEGPVYKAATSAFQAGLKPVYRFWSPKGQSHFYTIDEGERDQLMKDFPDFWAFEGVAFYAYPEGAQPAEGMPVYRLWKPGDSSHFYTMDPAERDTIMREYPDVYIDEGVAFYAYRL